MKARGFDINARLTKRVYLEHGDLADALSSGMSIPDLISRLNALWEQTGKSASADIAVETEFDSPNLHVMAWFDREENDEEYAARLEIIRNQEILRQQEAQRQKDLRRSQNKIAETVRQLQKQAEQLGYTLVEKK